MFEYFAPPFRRDNQGTHGRIEDKADIYIVCRASPIRSYGFKVYEPEVVDGFAQISRDISPFRLEYLHHTALTIHSSAIFSTQ